MLPARYAARWHGDKSMVGCHDHIKVAAAQFCGIRLKEKTMSACAMLSYNGLTRGAWDSVKKAAAPYGVTGKDSGSAETNGFTVVWSYVEASRTLHIQCTDSPFWASCSAINSTINDEVVKCISAHNIQMRHMLPA